MQAKAQLRRPPLTLTSLVTLILAGSLSCGQAPEPDTIRSPVVERQVPPCTQTPSEAELDQLEALLNEVRPPARPRAGSGWGTTELNAVMSERSAVVWWWAKAPEEGAHTRPPEPPSALFNELERCEWRWRWQARQGALWALTVMSARPHQTPIEATRAPRILEAHGELAPTLTLIVACTPCRGATQREPFGSPLALMEELEVHINTLISTKAQERWLGTRLRSPAQSLVELRSQACRCRYR